MNLYPLHIARKVMARLKEKPAETVDYWDNSHTCDAPTYWWNYKVVPETVRSYTYGQPELPWFTREIAAAPDFGRVLAFGDGYSVAIEAAITRVGSVREIVYFNLSEGESQRFEAQYLHHSLTFPHRCVIGDANRFDFTTLGVFDTIVAVGCLHHFYDLNRIFRRLNAILTENGRFYAEEFVGPSKWKYGREKLIIKTLNRWQKELPSELIRSRQPIKGLDFYRHWKTGVDPSECVRSGELDHALREHFTLLRTDGFGGSLLFPWFLTAQLAEPRLHLAHWQSELGTVVLRELIEQERQLIASGKISPHFIDYVMTKKGVG